MATRAPRPCSIPGCGELVTDATAQCIEHRRIADQRKGTTAQRGYGGKWPRIRARFLAYHPYCEVCAMPATDVDHRNGDKSECHWWNLRALCSLHHRQRTARDQPGGARLP